MTAYYNENDPKAAAWLRELIKKGLIAPGDVDERSIEDILPSELAGYTQCHFFAGIGGWSYALRLAGWPDDKPVWTGSCPCQPFSAAGKGGGFSDERHLWPTWHYLIEKLKPTIVFGEQVASSNGLAWFDLVYSDMEETEYTCAAVDLCAAGVGAPHIRQRLYWVASLDNSAGAGLQGVHRQSPDHPVVMRSAANIASGDNWKTEPAVARVANGLSGGVGLVRGYGNAIVPQVAAEFISAYQDSLVDEQ